MRLEKQNLGLLVFLIMATFFAGCTANDTFEDVPKNCFFYPVEDHDLASYDHFLKWRDGKITTKEFNSGTPPGQGTSNIGFKWREPTCDEYEQTWIEKGNKKPAWAKDF